MSPHHSTVTSHPAHRHDGILKFMQRDQPISHPPQDYEGHRSHAGTRTHCVQQRLWNRRPRTCSANYCDLSARPRKDVIMASHGMCIARRRSVILMMMRLASAWLNAGRICVGTCRCICNMNIENRFLFGSGSLAGCCV